MKCYWNSTWSNLGLTCIRRRIQFGNGGKDNLRVLIRKFRVSKQTNQNGSQVIFSKLVYTTSSLPCAAIPAATEEKVVAAEEAVHTNFRPAVVDSDYYLPFGHLEVPCTRET